MPDSLRIADATERMRKDDNQRTALHNAAKSGEDLGIIKLVIKEGANVNAKHADGWTALHFAAMNGKENATLALLQHGANVHARTVPPRMDSWEGKLKRKFLGGRTPLHWAAAEGYEATVQTVLDYHADPGAKNTSYRTPLQEAIMQGHEHVARILIALDAPINDADDEDYTPLHQACNVGVKSPKAKLEIATVAELLIDRGADIEAVTANENIWGDALSCRVTPSILSALQNSTGTLALLIERGANLRACNQNGEMAIHVAAIIGYTAVISMLLDAGAEVDVRDQNLNETALHKAASQDRLPATALLLERGADPRTRNRNGRDVLQHTLAVQGIQNLEMIRLSGERLETLERADEEEPVLMIV